MYSGSRVVRRRTLAHGHGAGQGVLVLPDGQSGPYAQWGKRLFDVVAAALSLASAFVLMAIIAAIISLDGGKPFFAHTRIGRNGQKFRCLKFRTMVTDAEARLQRLLREDPEAAAEWAADYKLRNDPRVTRLGLFLRKSSLDELPQLWNVIRGDMSLVGPRPVTEPEIALYGKDATAYYSVRPGITGLWQVSGRNEVSFQERVDLDREYTQELSLWQDLRILVRTVTVVLRVTGC